MMSEDVATWLFVLKIASRARRDARSTQDALACGSNALSGHLGTRLRAVLTLWMSALSFLSACVHCDEPRILAQIRSGREEYVQ